MRLYDVHDSSPTGRSVAIDGVDQGLGDGLKELVGTHVLEPEGLAHAWRNAEGKGVIIKIVARSPFLILPSSCSSAVPATTKSSGLVLHPIRSIEQMKLSLVTGSNPATIGSTKKGPNLLS